MTQHHEETEQDQTELNFLEQREINLRSRQQRRSEDQKIDTGQK